MKIVLRPQYYRLRRILEMVREGTRTGTLPNCGHFTRELTVLLAYHGNWYLLAMNTASGRIETFALSHCRSITGTSEHFTRPADFDAGSFLKSAFGITQAEEVWNVRLLFAKEVATYICERAWHPSQQLVECDDGSLEMRLETSGRKELTRWILSWVPHVKVLSPQELQQRVLKRLREGLMANQIPVPGWPE